MHADTDVDFALAAAPREIKVAVGAS